MLNLHTPRSACGPDTQSAGLKEKARHYSLLICLVILRRLTVLLCSTAVTPISVKSTLSRLRSEPD
jgi:hypothetical protein